MDFCVQDYGSRGSPSKSPAPKASTHSSIIILTSGTTGTPKRGESEHSADVGAHRRDLSRILAALENMDEKPDLSGLARCLDSRRGKPPVWRARQLPVARDERGAAFLP